MMESEKEIFIKKVEAMIQDAEDKSGNHLGIESIIELANKIAELVYPTA